MDDKSNSITGFIIRQIELAGSLRKGGASAREAAFGRVALAQGVLTLDEEGRLSRRQRRFLTVIPDFYPVIPAKAGIQTRSRP